MYEVTCKLQSIMKQRSERVWWKTEHENVFMVAIHIKKYGATPRRGKENIKKKKKKNKTPDDKIKCYEMEILG